MRVVSTETDCPRTHAFFFAFFEVIKQWPVVCIVDPQDGGWDAGRLDKDKYSKYLQKANKGRSWIVFDLNSYLNTRINSKFKNILKKKK